jgi:hypothetical protein
MAWLQRAEKYFAERDHRGDRRQSAADANRNLSAAGVQLLQRLELGPFKKEEEENDHQNEKRIPAHRREDADGSDGRGRDWEIQRV